MKFRILLLSLLPYFLNAESFLTLKVSDLTFKDGEKPNAQIDSTQPYALQYSRSLKMWLPSNLPYCRTQDASETFLSFKQLANFSSRNRVHSTDDLVLCFHNPKQKVQGELFLYQDKVGWKPFSFSFEKKNRVRGEKSEEEYLTYRITRYQWLQDLQVPGTAWYRHNVNSCLLYTSPSPRDLSTSRMPSSA